MNENDSYFKGHVLKKQGFAVLSILFLLFSGLAQGENRTGKEIVDTVCSACHVPGLNNAPRIGDKQAWKARTAQGLSGLTQHALNGIRNMPAHGGQPNLSDIEIARAITYMVDASGGNWVEPINPSQIGRARTGKEIVAAQCSNCHEKGIGGAPKIGDLQAWAPRVRHGIPYLVSSAIHGHGGMPPRGGQANLTDSELSSAILYMVNPASANTPRASPEARQSATDWRNDPNHKIVDGVEIYVGYVSAANIRALPKGSPELSMHGGVPEGDNYYHVNVSLFDANSGSPINNAHVTLDMNWPGQATAVVNLEPTFAEGTGSYGNYIKAQPSVTCPMTLHVMHNGVTVDANFSHSFD